MGKVKLGFLGAISLFWGCLYAYGTSCDLYPIAIDEDVVAQAAVGQLFDDIEMGGNHSQFSWVTWAGSPNVPTLVSSLTVPGNSDTYVNPNDDNDHLVSVGDELMGKPGVSNAKAVRNALSALNSTDIILPLYNQQSGNGANTRYTVSGFATFRLVGYNLRGKDTISIIYKGMASCSSDNVAPIV